jgi:hypothetical protein
VSPVLSVQSDMGCAGSEPCTSLDTILDTEVIKYFFIFPRQRKILSSRLLTKKIRESHFQCLKNSWKLTQVPSVSYLESYMKIYNLCMACDVHVNGVKGPVMKGRERHIIRVDWVKQSSSDMLTDMLAVAVHLL